MQLQVRKKTGKLKGKASGKAKPASGEFSSRQTMDGVPMAMACPDDAGCGDKAIIAKVNRLYITKLKVYDKSELNKLIGKTTRLSVFKYFYNGSLEIHGTNKTFIDSFLDRFFD